MAAVLEQQVDLRLRFDAAPGGRTFIGQQYARYPFHVCRAQYMDPIPAGMATVYLQSSAGGIFANDRLSCEFVASPEAAAHVTTQASTIVHRMDRGDAYHDVHIIAKEKSYIEYLPDPVILFPRASLMSSITVCMHPTATVMLSDAFTGHDPAEGSETFDLYRSATRVESESGDPWCIDRYQVGGDQYREPETGVLGDAKTHGTLMILAQQWTGSGLVDMLRDSLPSTTGLYAGVSSLPGGRGAWARFIAGDSVDLRDAMTRVWVRARRELLGSDPHPRKK